MDLQHLFALILIRNFSKMLLYPTVVGTNLLLTGTALSVQFTSLFTVSL
jgi:hypothetical protein